MLLPSDISNFAPFLALQEVISYIAVSNCVFVNATYTLHAKIPLNTVNFTYVPCLCYKGTRSFWSLIYMPHKFCALKLHKAHTYLAASNWVVENNIYNPHWEKTLNTLNFTYVPRHCYGSTRSFWWSIYMPHKFCAPNAHKSASNFVVVDETYPLVYQYCFFWVHTCV